MVEAFVCYCVHRRYGIALSHFYHWRLPINCLSIMRTTTAPTFMRSARRERHTGDRIFHLLAEVERYDLMANQILADPKKSSN